MKTQSNTAKNPPELGNSKGFERLDETGKGSLVGSLYSAKAEVIKEFTSLGCSVLPVAPGVKYPSYLNENGTETRIVWKQYQGNQPTQADLNKWFSNPSNGLGVLPNGNLSVIDLDRKRFSSQEECDKTYNTILSLLPSSTYSERTLNGGYHLLIESRETFDGRNFKIGVDGSHAGEIMDGGSFTVVAPTEGYTALAELSIGVIESFSHLGIQPNKTKATKPESESTKPESVSTLTPRLSSLLSKKNQDILSGVESDIEDKSKALTQVIRDAYGWVNFLSTQNLGYSESTGAIVERCASTLGIDSAKADRVIKTIDLANCLPQLHIFRGENGCLNYYNAKLSHLRSYDEGSADSKDKTPKIVKQLQFMRSVLGESVRYNRIKFQFEYNGQPITHPDELHLDCVEKWNKSIPYGVFRPNLYKVGREQAFNPVQDYLNESYGAFTEQEEVDTGILDNLASLFFGCDDPIAQIYLKKYLIGAVARAFNDNPKGHPLRKKRTDLNERPAKMDTVLMLMGEQGDKKSTFFATLFGDFFWDGLGDIADKDQKRQAHTFWGIEWAELETVFTKRGNSQVKGYVTAESDNIRAPYAAQSEDLRRKFVLCGTTNESEFLTDSTGSRRFWPVRVLQEIPLTQLKGKRDLLWGAAMQLFLDGEIWWLTPEEETLRKASSQEFQSKDEWEELILNEFGGREYLSPFDIYEFLQIDNKSLDGKVKRRITKILEPLGWVYKNKKIGEQVTKNWFNPRFLQSKTDRAFVDLLNACTTQSDLDDSKKEFIETDYKGDYEGFKDRVERYVTVSFAPKAITQMTAPTLKDIDRMES